MDGQEGIRAETIRKRKDRCGMRKIVDWIADWWLEIVGGLIAGRGVIGMMGSEVGSVERVGWAMCVLVGGCGLYMAGMDKMVKELRHRMDENRLRVMREMEKILGECTRQSRMSGEMLGQARGAMMALSMEKKQMEEGVIGWMKEVDGDLDRMSGQIDGLAEIVKKKG